MLIIEILLFLSLGSLLFTYSGYPVLVWFLGIFKSESLPEHLLSDDLPIVSVIIPAKNEAPQISSKISNCFEFSYPKSKLEILIIDDGSDDATAEQSRNYFLKNQRTEEYMACRVVRRELSQGKAGAINCALNEAQGDYLMFTDADCRLDPNALDIMMRRMLSDKKNACVAGRYLPCDLRSEQNTGAQSWYWKYEDFIRRCESRFGGLLGASGALYLARNSLVTPLPLGLINDDFVIPMRLLLKGHRTIYEPLALGREYEREIEQNASELSRRIRIMAGNWQHLFLFARLLTSSRNRFWPTFQMIGHKLCRVLSPMFLITALLTNILLVLIGNSTFYDILLLLQFIAYGFALLGAWSQPSRLPVLGTLVKASNYFVLINISAVYGLIYALSGLHKVKWGSAD